MLYSSTDQQPIGIRPNCQLWSQLEVLAIWQDSQLSLPVFSELLSHLPNLKLVALPERITLNDPVLFRSIREHLLGRDHPVKITSKKLYPPVCELWRA